MSRKILVKLHLLKREDEVLCVNNFPDINMNHLRARFEISKFSPCGFVKDFCLEWSRVEWNYEIFNEAKNILRNTPRRKNLDYEKFAKTKARRTFDSWMSLEQTNVKHSWWIHPSLWISFFFKILDQNVSMERESCFSYTWKDWPYVELYHLIIFVFESTQR